MDEEIDLIEGSAQIVDFVEHAGKTYEEVLTNMPQYVEYLATEEDQWDHLGAKKFTKWIKRQKCEKA